MTSTHRFNPWLHSTLSKGRVTARVFRLLAITFLIGCSIPNNTFLAFKFVTSDRYECIAPDRRECVHVNVFALVPMVESRLIATQQAR